MSSSIAYEVLGIVLPSLPGIPDEQSEFELFLDGATPCSEQSIATAFDVTPFMLPHPQRPPPHSALNSERTETR